MAIKGRTDARDDTVKLIASDISILTPTSTQRRAGRSW